MKSYANIKEENHARFKHFREAFAEFLIDVYYSNLKEKEET